MQKYLIVYLIALWTNIAYSAPKGREPIMTQKERIVGVFGPLTASLEDIKVSAQIEQSNPEGGQKQIKSEIFLRDIMLTVGKVDVNNALLPGITTTCRDINIDLRGHPELYIKLMVNTIFKTPTKIELNIVDIKLNLAKDYIASNSIGVCTGLFNLRDPVLERILRYSLRNGMAGFNFLGNTILDRLDEYPNF